MQRTDVEGRACEHLEKCRAAQADLGWISRQRDRTVAIGKRGFHFCTVMDCTSATGTAGATNQVHQWRYTSGALTFASCRIHAFFKQLNRFL
jgi:hypothetical protein